MRFKRTRRVRFNANPLVNVTCQVAYPRLLRLEAGIPIEFQDTLKAHYPILEVGESITFKVTQSSGDGQKTPTPSPPLPTRSKVWQFHSADRQWNLSITSESLSLACSKYEAWEGFRDRLRAALDALFRIYEPTLVNRVMLQYHNLITRSNIGLTNVPWSDLLRRDLIGLSADPAFSPADIILSHGVFVANLDVGKVQITHGLGMAKRRMPDNSTEDGYTIQGNFYDDSENRFNIENILGILHDYNRQAGGLFQWCIQERLLRALEPTDLPDS